MFKRTLIALVIMGMLVWATPVFAKRVVPPARMCLNSGSYLFTMTGNSIFRMKMDVGFVTEVVRLPINMEGASPDEHITANACDVFFAWAKPGQQSEIWAMNASTGWELRKITHTPFTAEKDPVLNHWNSRLAFEERNDLIQSLVSTNLEGHRRRVEARFGYSPAWGDAGELTYSQSDGRIYIWGAEGSWHTYFPDGMGILVQQEPKFVTWPAVGLPRDFGNYRSVSYRPSGNLAAVITTDGSLMILSVGPDWLPNGDPVPATGLSDLTFVTWISVP